MILKKGGLFLGLICGAILSVVFVGGFLIGAAFDRHQVNAAYDVSDPDVQNFLTAYHLVTQRSYFRPFDKHHLLYAAIDGMLSATGDPHTIFLSPPQNKQATNDLNGTKFSGIGAIVQPSATSITILSPVPGSPAARAGLKPNDIVTKVDGKPVSSMGGDSAVAAIHGRVGTVVKLTVVRKHGTPFVVSVTRGQIQPITAYGRVLRHHLGYIQVFSFGDGTADQFAAALRQLKSKHVHGLIIDLRQNPGGFVDAAQQMVSDLLTNGVVAYEEQTDKSLTPLNVLDGHQILHVPIAILVDSGTASAAEITSAALREEASAVLVGTRTYGKGSMQSVYTLSDGSTIRLTDRLWLTPDKQSVSNRGLKPDFTVTDTTGNGPDPQLTTAEKYLEGKLKRPTSRPITP